VPHNLCAAVLYYDSGLKYIYIQPTNPKVYRENNFEKIFMVKSNLRFGRIAKYIIKQLTT
jgi:hypothetical protein